MMNIPSLIRAVQLGSLKDVQAVLQGYKKQQVAKKESKNWLINKVSEGVPGNGITALHVACKCYALSKNNAGRDTYNEIVKLLLEFGANPFAEAYTSPKHFREQAITPIDACQRNLPPSLQKALSDRAERYHRDLYGPKRNWGKGRSFSSGVAENWLCFCGDLPGEQVQDTKETA